MQRALSMAVGLMCLSMTGHLSSAGDKKDAGPKLADPPLIILDAQGKEVKVITWHFASGTRRLPGSDGAPVKPPPSRGGPEYLEFREESSTTYQVGILTLVPVTALRKLDYEYDKKTVKAVVATEGGKDETL